MQSKVLLTGYKNGSRYDRSTSKMLIEKIINYDTFLFSNDFNKIIEEVKSVASKNYDYILMFGHKPIIKKLLVEVECSIGNDYKFTNFPLKIILNLFKSNNIDYKLSETPGNSYCNFAYYQMLKYIEENELGTKVIFIHIPYKDNFIQFDEVVNVLNGGVEV